MSMSVISQESVQKQQTGERWQTVVKYEYYGARDAKPSRTTTQRDEKCLTPENKEAKQALIKLDTLEKLKGKCDVLQQREEQGKQQLKLSCKDGTLAETVTIQRGDGSLGYMVTINMPGKGGIAVTGEVAKVPGGCDPEKIVMTPKTPPSPPAVSVTSEGLEKE